MKFKARTPSEQLKVLRLLYQRARLTPSEESYYLNLEKGYEGEVQFDLLTEELGTNCLLLNDLLLEFNNTRFQIDTVAIFQESVYLFEVKNYDGEFSYDDGNLYTISGKEIKNPLDQLKRSKSLFRQLVQGMGYHYIIDAYVIFINPEFTLFHSPQGLSYILPTQLNRFMKKLNSKTSHLNNSHRKLAEKLLSLHLKDSPYTRLPEYQFEGLKKGITCVKCGSFSVVVQRYEIKCGECDFGEKVEMAVLRAIDEFKLLWPNRKITTNVIYEWCGGNVSKKKILRVLRKNFKINGVGQWAFYE